LIYGTDETSMLNVAQTTPLILGFDVCGEVVEVGSAVTQFQVGDQVYGALGLSGA
jgi:NADPH:quinone reductase-like Zn-dependent oxidoreductase